MTRVSAVPTAPPHMGDRLRRAVERVLPWYDPQREAQRTQRTEAIRQRSIAARIAVENLTPAERDRVRAAYAAYARELERRQ